MSDENQCLGQKRQVLFIYNLWASNYQRVTVEFLKVNIFKVKLYSQFNLYHKKIHWWLYACRKINSDLLLKWASSSLTGCAILRSDCAFVSVVAEWISYSYGPRSRLCGPGFSFQQKKEFMRTITASKQDQNLALSYTWLLCCDRMLTLKGCVYWRLNQLGRVYERT